MRDHSPFICTIEYLLHIKHFGHFSFAKSSEILNIQATLSQTTTFQTNNFIFNWIIYYPQPKQASSCDQDFLVLLIVRTMKLSSDHLCQCSLYGK